MATSTIRALVVDDSALYRKFVTSVLNEIKGVEVVGKASNGRIGLEKIQLLKPDMITLDLEMPELDGLGMLREMSTQNINVPTIVVSSLTAEGAKSTNAALQLGAFDFVLKPIGKGPDESRAQLKRKLAPKIHACVSALKEPTKKPSARKRISRPPADNAVERMERQVKKVCRKAKIVGIGISTGGPVTLNKILPKLPANFPCPILIVQHMPPLFTKSLADDLNRICAVEVMEAAEGMIAKPGQVFIAPGGAQMRVAKIDDQPVIQITNDPAERSCRPSADYLFRSIAEAYGDRAVGAVLTGMGDDGTIGCISMKRAGATIITQDEDTCTVYGMPKCVFDAGLSDQVVPLDGIPDSLLDAVGQGAIA